MRTSSSRQKKNDKGAGLFADDESKEDRSNRHGGQIKGNNKITNVQEKVQKRRSNIFAQDRNTLGHADRVDAMNLVLSQIDDELKQKSVILI